jgi:hypothetical protein
MITVITVAYLAASSLVFAATIWVLSRKPKPSQAARVAAAQARTAPTPPATDTRPGTNTAAADMCEQLWALPERHPGPERLRQAIRDEQNGDNK